MLTVKDSTKQIRVFLRMHDCRLCKSGFSLDGVQAYTVYNTFGESVSTTDTLKGFRDNVHNNGSMILIEGVQQ